MTSIQRGDTLFAVTQSGDQLLTLTVEHSDHTHTRFTGGYWAHTPDEGKVPRTVHPPGPKRIDGGCRTFQTEESAREYMYGREHLRLTTEVIKAAAGCTKWDVTVEELREVIHILTRRKGNE